MTVFSHKPMMRGRSGTLLMPLALLLVCWLAAETMPAYMTGPEQLRPPGTGHLLGTNAIGQSVLIGLIRAAPLTISIALFAGALALSVAFVGGCLTAFFPRFLGAFVIRLVDVLQILPSTLLLLLFASWLQPGYTALVVALTITAWHDDVRPIRAVVQRELSRESVILTRAMGGGRLYCLIQHVVPAIEPTLTALYFQNAIQVTMRTAGLAFLGLIDPRLVTWGGMMQDAMDYLHDPAWSWLLLPPALSLSSFLLLMMGLAARTERRVSLQDEANP